MSASATTGNGCRSRLMFDGNNVSPRVGVAYAPGDGRTVIRANAGIYFDRIPLRATSNAIQRDGTHYQTAVLSFGQLAAPAWPGVLNSFPAGVLVSITNINPAIQNQRNDQVGVQVERALGSPLVDASRLHARSRSRHHHVAQRERPDADAGAGGRRRHCQSRPSRSALRQHLASTIRSATPGSTV